MYKLCIYSAAERSYPTSKVRGRSREDPMPEGQRPRGVTPHPRSGATMRGVTSRPRSGAVARRRYPMPQA